MVPDDAQRDQVPDRPTAAVDADQAAGPSPSSGDVTRILAQIEQGQPQAAEQLLPLVYDELRRLAACKMAYEKPGQTLQATALVHEAYIRLVDVQQVRTWSSRGHFFAAAAEAMRRILVEAARAKDTRRRGGEGRRVDLLEFDAAVLPDLDSVLDLDAALSNLTQADSLAGQLVSLRVFAGMTIREVGDYLSLSPHQAKRTWTYARVWLRREIEKHRVSAD